MNRLARSASGVLPALSSDKGTTPIADVILQSAAALRKRLAGIKFGPPVTHVYNPLDYAWEPFADYVRRYASTRKRVVFVGMNPGPFGMVQTGVPFGEIPSARDWLRISGKVQSPPNSHPKRPVLGFDCRRSEVSGKRLWGLFAQRFGKPELFFEEHTVLNYCPLAFMESTGRNRTPDKLTPGERAALYEACDLHLREVLEALEPLWVIGIGGFAAERIKHVCEGRDCSTGQVLHPSPACPAANRDWSGTVTRQLMEMGVW